MPATAAAVAFLNELCGHPRRVRLEARPKSIRRKQKQQATNTGKKPCTEDDNADASDNGKPADGAGNCAEGKHDKKQHEHNDDSSSDDSSDSSESESTCVRVVQSFRVLARVTRVSSVSSATRFVTGSATVIDHPSLSRHPVTFNTYSFLRGSMHVGPIDLPAIHDPLSCVFVGTILYGIAVVADAELSIAGCATYTMFWCVNGDHLYRMTRHVSSGIGAVRSQLRVPFDDGSCDESIYVATTVLAGDYGPTLDAASYGDAAVDPPPTIRVGDIHVFMQALAQFCGMASVYTNFCRLICEIDDANTSGVMSRRFRPGVVQTARRAVDDSGDDSDRNQVGGGKWFTQAAIDAFASERFRDAKSTVIGTNARGTSVSDDDESDFSC